MTMHPDDNEKKMQEACSTPPEAEQAAAPTEAPIEFDAEAEEEMLRRLRAMGYVE